MHIWGAGPNPGSFSAGTGEEERGGDGDDGDGVRRTIESTRSPIDIPSATGIEAGKFGESVAFGEAPAWPGRADEGDTSSSSESCEDGFSVQWTQ